MRSESSACAARGFRESAEGARPEESDTERGADYPEPRTIVRDYTLKAMKMWQSHFSLTQLKQRSMFGSESKVLQDLWKIKDEAYDEVAHRTTLKEKIHARVRNSQESAKKIKELHSDK